MIESAYKNVLILTATIKPKSGVPNLIRSDPVERLADYQRALRNYINYIGSKIHSIIFVDNSNYDLSSLQQIAIERNVLDQVSFISFDGLDYPPEFDRGYGEMMMLDYVMEHDHVRAMPNNTVFWKVTGRYIIENFSDIVDTYPRNADVYCNMRNIPRKLVDMYLMAWSKSGYSRVLAGKYHFIATSAVHIEKKVHPEELLRQQFPQNLKLENVVPRFRFTPKIRGFRAGDNKQYDKDSRWKYLIRRSASLMLPYIWI